MDQISYIVASELLDLDKILGSIAFRESSRWFWGLACILSVGGLHSSDLNCSIFVDTGHISHICDWNPRSTPNTRNPTKTMCPVKSKRKSMSSKRACSPGWLLLNLPDSALNLSGMNKICLDMEWTKSVLRHSLQCISFNCEHASENLG